MDLIDTIDWGAYAHFTFVGNKYPDVMPIMQAAYYVSSYVSIGAVAVLALAIFALQNRLRAVLTMLVALIAALTLIVGLRLSVPRRRPPDAENWLGADQMLGSYPSASVFLFLLALIYLGAALWPWLNPRWGKTVYIIVAAVLTVWIALSQFFLAIHFVSDVVGGIAGAIFVAWLMSKILPVTDPDANSSVLIGSTQ